MAETETQQNKVNKIRMKCDNKTQARECHLNKGLIIIKEEYIISTTDKYTIADTIETEDFDFILVQIEELFNYLRMQNDSHFQTLIPTYELLNVDQNFKLAGKYPIPNYYSLPKATNEAL